MTEQTITAAPASSTSGYSNLNGVDRVLAETATRPRWPIYIATAAAVLLAWLWLTFMAASVAGSTGAGQLGPGMAMWQGWLDALNIDASSDGMVGYILKICTPQAPTGIGSGVIISTFLMWLLMSLAMMLPSAAPMLRTYGDIADVAAQKNEKVVPLVILALGYLTVWGVFAAAATLIQLGLVVGGLAADPVFPLKGLVGGLLLMLAGFYQFSGLKNACLEKCRNPFSILFGRWTTEPMGVFRIGAEQGVFCVGCCWALMLVMLVVGTMNLAWMALFTLFAIVEKSGRGKVTSHVSGGILLAWGGILTTLSALSF